MTSHEAQAQQLRKSEVSSLGKRRYPRREFVKKIGAFHQGLYHIAHSGEIGEGGLLIYMDSPIAVGDQMVLNFQVPGGEFVSVRVEVKSSHKQNENKTYGHGVSFLNMPFHQKRMIRSFVSERPDNN